MGWIHHQNLISNPMNNGFVWIGLAIGIKIIQFSDNKLNTTRSNNTFAA